MNNNTNNNNNNNNNLNFQLQTEHRWLAIGSLLYDLMGREAVELEREGRKDYEIVEMLVRRIDKALTEEFGQLPLTESDITKLIQGIDMITMIAEAKIERMARQ